MTMSYENARYANSRTLRRLFSSSGKFVGLRRLPQAMRSFSTAIRRKLSDVYPDEPFIPYSATATLATLLSPKHKVVEVGAGMSTTWLAARVDSVVSYEWDEDWYRRVISALDDRGLRNVEVRLCRGHEKMGFDDFGTASVDMAFIDGGPRSMCLANLWPKLKRGGLAYLDNWDIDLFWLEGGYDAREFLRAHRDEIGMQRLFVDFVPAFVNVSEGLLVQKDTRAEASKPEIPKIKA
jgi:predicted O-methyltransferase YrrM